MTGPESSAKNNQGRVLDIDSLSVRFRTQSGYVEAVRNTSLKISQGEILGVVGESGSGKTTLGRAILGLLDDNAEIASGTITLAGKDVLALGDEDLRAMRGSVVSTVFQNPLSSLNPAFRIGWQIEEALYLHNDFDKPQRRDMAMRVLEDVGLRPDLMDAYPHQLSGGMRQRVALGIAIVNRPALIIADEPTTALDVTVQSQILRLLISLVDSESSSLLLITHNLGVVASICERVAVMYGGEIVEVASVDRLFAQPRHPYTRALIGAIPKPGARVDDLTPIVGRPPSLTRPIEGCVFRPRCPHSAEMCSEHPPLIEAGTGHLARCWMESDGWWDKS